MSCASDRGPIAAADYGLGNRGSGYIVDRRVSSAQRVHEVGRLHARRPRRADAARSSSSCSRSSSAATHASGVVGRPQDGGAPGDLAQRGDVGAHHRRRPAPSPRGPGSRSPRAGSGSANTSAPRYEAAQVVIADPTDRADPVAQPAGTARAPTAWSSSHPAGPASTSRCGTSVSSRPSGRTRRRAVPTFFRGSRLPSQSTYGRSSSSNARARARHVIVRWRPRGRRRSARRGFGRAGSSVCAASSSAADRDTVITRSARRAAAAMPLRVEPTAAPRVRLGVEQRRGVVHRHDERRYDRRRRHRDRRARARRRRRAAPAGDRAEPRPREAVCHAS